MKLYRRRYIPEETIPLDLDEIIYHDDEMLVTKWNAIRPRPDFVRGYSCCFLKRGTKVSKRINAAGALVEHYIDIVEYESGEDSLTTNDLLVDVIVKPDGRVSIEDMGELGVARSKGLITEEQMKNALTLCDNLLTVIYGGGFSEYIRRFDEIVRAYEPGRLGEPKKAPYSTVVPLDLLLSEGSAVEEQPSRETPPPVGAIRTIKPRQQSANKARSAKPANDNPHAGHRDRMRQKVLNAGIDALADHEIIELLLYYCVAQGNVNPLAHRLLDEYGALYGLLDAPAEEISLRCGVNIRTALLFTLIPEVYKRYETSKWDEKAPMNRSAKAAAYLYTLLGNKTDECMYMLCLDNQQRLIQCCLVSEGSVSETTIYPRNIVKTVLKYNASYVIISHNHPSGILTPSQGDINTTSIIINALRPIGIDVLDHLIISGRNYYSFAEKKLMGLGYEK